MVLRFHFDFVQCIGVGSEMDRCASIDVAMSMEQAAAQELKSLLVEGAWQNPLQLPRNYVRGPRSFPWHGWDWPEPIAKTLGSAKSHLQQHWRQLRGEYYDLHSNGHMERERECIHDAAAGDASAWKRCDPTEPHGPQFRSDGDGCLSTLAPQACSVLSYLRHTANLPVIRDGYSAIGPHGKLRPHFGMTNGQLKFHLGLVVPRTPNADCATFRVGNETRYGCCKL